MTAASSRAEKEARPRGTIDIGINEISSKYTLIAGRLRYSWACNLINAFLAPAGAVGVATYRSQPIPEPPEFDCQLLLYPVLRTAPAELRNWTTYRPASPCGLTGVCI